jgi:hypothetical protein
MTLLLEFGEIEPVKCSGFFNPGNRDGVRYRAGGARGEMELGSVGEWTVAGTEISTSFNRGAKAMPGAAGETTEMVVEQTGQR